MSWDTTTLCTRTDIENELGDLTTLVQVSDSEQDDVIQRAIATSKTLITNRLRASLPDIFVSSVGQYTNLQFGDWITQRGYSYTDLDPVLDMITNISVLNSAAVALTIACLVKRMIVQFKASYNTSLGLLGDQRSFWQNEYEMRMRDAEKQLTLDLSGDGIIQDFERKRTHVNFFRN